MVRDFCKECGYGSIRQSKLLDCLLYSPEVKLYATNIDLEYLENDEDYCPHCNRVIKDSWDICPYCGNNLSVYNKLGVPNIQDKILSGLVVLTLLIVYLLVLFWL